jgi:hypothetical protein
MWKIAAVLLLTALAILGARLAYQGPAFLTPPLMYAGVRG